MNKIRTSTDEISIDEHGIIHKKVMEGAHIDLPELLESEEAITKLSKEQKILILVDARALHTMTPDAVKQLKLSLDTKRIASAVVSGGLGMRILVDYLANIEKTVAPIKIFGTKEEALEWLLTFKKDKSNS